MDGSGPGQQRPELRLGRAGREIGLVFGFVHGQNGLELAAFVLQDPLGDQAVGPLG